MIYGSNNLGFFKKLFSASRVTDEKMWDSNLWNLTGYNTQSSEDINEYSALTYSAVWNAVTLISGTIAALPLHLMQQQGKNTSPSTTLPLYRTMHSAANPFMTAMAVREVMLAHVLTWGNGYAEIVRSVYGDVVELWPITPNRVTPKMKDGDMVYEIEVDGETVLLPRENVLHIAGIGFDGFIGYSVIHQARECIGLAKSMETFGSNFFSNGTHPGTIVEHPGKLSETAHKNLKDSLSVAHSGLGKSHKLMLLEEGMKLETLGIPPNDAQFLESRQFTIPEVARWYNLPPHKLKDLTKSSFNNIEAEQTSFVVDSLLPWAVRLEQSYNQQLLTLKQFKTGLYFKHVFEGLLRGSSKDRADFYGALLDRGVFSINDVREKEDMNPVDGGDIHLVPLNMQKLEDVGKILPKPNKEGEDFIASPEENED